MIHVGSTCYFEFTSDFESLNGIYKVRGEITFKDAISSGVDFLENLYVPAGLDKTSYIEDYPRFNLDRVAILESILNSNLVYYVPESIFLKVPDPTIREYYPLVMVINLGVHKNNQVVLPLIDHVKDLISSTLGTTEPVRVVSSEQNKVYLTESQYHELELARADNIAEISPLSVQLKAEQEKNTYLAAKVAHYESLIAQMSTP